MTFFWPTFGKRSKVKVFHGRPLVVAMVNYENQSSWKNVFSFYSKKDICPWAVNEQFKGEHFIFWKQYFTPIIQEAFLPFATLPYKSFLMALRENGIL